MIPYSSTSAGRAALGFRRAFSHECRPIIPLSKEACLNRAEPACRGFIKFNPRFFPNELVKYLILTVKGGKCNCIGVDKRGQTSMQFLQNGGEVLVGCQIIHFPERFAHIEQKRLRGGEIDIFPFISSNHE